MYDSTIKHRYEESNEDRDTKIVKINNITYNVEILDTANEDDYAIMMDMWISYGEGFIFVFAINDKSSFERMQPLRERIIKAKHGANVPILLVGNMQDLSNDRQVKYEEAKKLADSWGIDYIETSAKTNYNCKEAFESIIRKIGESKLPVKKKSCPCNIY